MGRGSLTGTTQATEPNPSFMNSLNSKVCESSLLRFLPASSSVRAKRRCKAAVHSQREMLGKLRILGSPTHQVTFQLDDALRGSFSFPHSFSPLILTCVHQPAPVETLGVARLFTASVM